VIRYIAFAVGPWLFKTVLYSVAFRKRHIKATLLTVLIIAGAPTLIAGIVPIQFLHLPHFLIFLLGVGVAVYLCKEYTNGTLFPDLIAIVIAVELLSLIFLEEIVLPILF
jgi:hypothetical protein